MAAAKKPAKASDRDVDNITPLFKGERVDRGEVVIGLVGAMGTDMDRITHELAAALTSVGYQSQPVRISELIQDFMEFQEVGPPPREDGTKLDELMDLGDALREGLEHGGAAAVLAVGKIKNTRTEAQLKSEGKTDGEADEVEIVERQKVATIVRQFKHPGEVEVFRSLYGPRFVLLGVWSSEKEREEAVNRRLHDEHPGQPEEWYAQQVRRLLIRDEQDTKKKLGQRVRATYELADAFIADSPGPDTAKQIQRVVHLLFGSPYVTPSRDEHAMFVASGASLRSSDAGRQVGAVVVDKDGEILVSGVNEIPKPGGGQYWPEDDDDLRDFQLGYDENARQKRAIITEILRSLQKQSWLADDKVGAPEVLATEAMSKTGPLTKSRVADLLEFARVAHAEMAAICTAARRGTALGGQTMYTTTYPCHECARLIISSGIIRVVYVDPYPKSQVRALYAREVTEEVQEGKVAFQPYRGIAPRLYRAVFQMTGRSRDSVSGKYEKWKASEARPRLANEAMVLNYVIAAEDQFYEGAFAFLQETDWVEVIETTLMNDDD